MFFLELSCFFHDPVDVGNLISGSSLFSKTGLNIWKFTIHVLLKPGLENFEHYFTSVSLKLCWPSEVNALGALLSRARPLSWGAWCGIPVGESLSYNYSPVCGSLPRVYGIWVYCESALLFLPISLRFLPDIVFKNISLFMTVSGVGFSSQASLVVLLRLQSLWAL